LAPRPFPMGGGAAATPESVCSSPPASGPQGDLKREGEAHDPATPPGAPGPLLTHLNNVGMQAQWYGPQSQAYTPGRPTPPPTPTPIHGALRWFSNPARAEGSGPSAGAGRPAASALDSLASQLFTLAGSGGGWRGL